MSSPFGGFTGFGQNNNNAQQQQQQPQNTGFSGFGQPANTNTGFGAPSNTTGFGANTNTGSSLFGGGTGFGTQGGFGNTSNQQNSLFGAAPKPFGSTPSTTTGGLFGSTTNTAAAPTFGGFGSTTTSAPSAFGTSTGGGLFSNNKPAFGTGNTATTSAFGNNTSSGFGSVGTALGQVPVPESQGTGAVQFQATNEKEANSSINQAFQSISFQPPYQKYSPEELRLADYAQGRKNGNASGQAGAFGASTGFGGFNSNQSNAFGGTSNTGGSLFGGTNTSTGPFGQPSTATSGFGAATGTNNSLFGQKPATTSSIFGSNNNNNSTGFGSANTGGNSLFGSANNTNTGFGSTGTTNSLFGSNANQNKPAFSFGPTPAATGTGFGAASGTAGFGNTSGTSNPFGTTQPQQNANPFGAANTQPSSGLFGGFGQTQPQNTTSLFGGANNQAKPAGGLFGGNTSTPSSLFGGTTATNNTNPFGGAATNTQTTSLFAPKPATTGTGLFGSNNTTNTGSLFGSTINNPQNQQGQQNPGSSIFGSSNQPPKPSLFTTQPSQPGTGLFGSTNQGNSGSLFQNNNQNQQQPTQSSLFGGGFSNSQQAPQMQPNSLTASITDLSAFGTSMFSNLATPEVQNPGPIATPLSSLSKQKKSAILPIYKMNPASASRYNTPQKRGFGFSYSTYGSPASASSTSSTPLTFGNSTLGGGFTQRLSKSVSTSSLRNAYTSGGSFNREDSILAPGAFSASPGTRFSNSGSMKKLVINRGMRVDLFTPLPSKDGSQTPPARDQPGILKKRVSFDSSTVGGSSNGVNGSSSPLKQVQSSSTPSAAESGFLRSSARNGNTNGSMPTTVTSQPEMEQVKGNELAIVPEEEPPMPPPPAPVVTITKDVSHGDQEPGAYWMRPSKQEILAMNRMQRQKVVGFTVGRDGVGQITFDAPVDLTNIDIDNLFGKLVILNTRSASVYPDAAKKPPMGKGLNVPSTIMLENSWPRTQNRTAPTGETAGPRFNKHVSRLKKVPDTRFISYNGETGVWTFSVDHFTTYGLEYEDDETDGEGVSEFGQSTLSAPPDTPTPQTRASRTPQSNESFVSASSKSGAYDSDAEDTFDFKKRKVLPGAFDSREIFEDDTAMRDESDEAVEQSFLDERSAGSPSEDGFDEPMVQDADSQERGLVRIEEQGMAGSFPQPDDTVEQEDDSQDDDSMNDMRETPGGIMRARMRAMRTSGTPLKRKLMLDDDDWAELLRKTVSPQKQDREQLKRLRDSVAEDASVGKFEPEGKRSLRGKVISDVRGFATSIDLMHSLFGDARSPAKAVEAPVKAKGFEWPYSKHSKTGKSTESDLSGNDRAFHDSLKPSWGPNGMLVFAGHAGAKPLKWSSNKARDQDGILVMHGSTITSEKRDVRFATFSTESSKNSIQKHKSMTTIEMKHNLPYAKLSKPFKIADFFRDKDIGGPAAAHEKLVWELASVLFDAIDIPKDLKDVPFASDLLRKEKLSDFWEKLVADAAKRHVAMAKSNEEKAIASLSGHRISDACGHLLNGKNFHLATLVPLIGGSEVSRKSIKEQLLDWQKSRAISEISQPIRAIYEILAGNVCVCDGAKGAAVEDRMDTFIISNRFGLDWRQAFGLRLWYAILASDSLNKAVHMFAEDLKQDKETSRPHVWYFEQGISPLWEDKSLELREDLLWGLLKLYAIPTTDLEAVLRPENSQLSPLEMRFSWQLSRALISSGRCSYGAEADDKADRLTLSFASQLSNEGNWLDATFVLLHLSSTAVRMKSIQDHLAHNASKIGSEDSESFITLSNDFRIPTSWIWEAKALYMRSVRKDSRLEVECLIRAGSFNEAHRTFTREVAPKAVIERDFATLQALLSGFKGKQATIAEWPLGGELYGDYLALQESMKAGKTDGTVVERLLEALPAMVAKERHASFLETVAVQEISGVVAKVAIEMRRTQKNNNASKVLNLPLTEDKRLKHTVNLSLGFYRSVMAGGG